MSLAYEPIRPSDPDYIERVLQARRMSISERILTGPKLFDIECQEEKVSIRSQFPDFTEEQVDEELGCRLKAIRDAEEVGIYRVVGVLSLDD